MKSKLPVKGRHLNHDVILTFQYDTEENRYMAVGGPDKTPGSAKAGRCQFVLGQDEEGKVKETTDFSYVIGSCR